VKETFPLPPLLLKRSFGPVGGIGPPPKRSPPPTLPLRRGRRGRRGVCAWWRAHPCLELARAAGNLGGFFRRRRNRAWGLGWRRGGLSGEPERWGEEPPTAARTT